MDARPTKPVQYWIVVALLAVVPIVFNPWAHSRYELQKVAAVAIGVGLGLLALLVRRDAGAWDTWHDPMARPVLAVLGTWVLSTLFSVSPAVSLLGLSFRSQGLYVAACYVAVFWWVAGTVRSSRCARPVLIAAALGSIPVCALGIYEHLVINPVVGRVTFSGRAASTLGSPMLLGGYLIMVIPLTMCVGWLARGRARIAWWTLVGGQVLCLALSGTRSAWAALLVVLCASLFVLGVRLRRRWVTGTAMGLPVLFLLLVLAVNAPWQMGLRLRELPLLQRLSIISEIKAGGGVERVRPTVWCACLRLLAGQTSVPIGSPMLRWARPLVGYGPETLAATFWTVFPEPLIRDEGRRIQVDRAHSLLIDAALERGLLGVAALVWLWLSFFRRSLRTLKAGRDPARSAVVGACLAGGVAHLVASQIGVELTASSLLLYACLGIAAGLTRPETQATETRQGPPAMPSLLRALELVLVAGGLATVCLLVAADAYFAKAFRSYRGGDLMGGAEAGHRAASLMPLQSDHHLLLSQVYAGFAARQPAPAQRIPAFRQSLALARAAIALQPLMPQYCEAAAKVCATAAAMGYEGFDKQIPRYWRQAIEICPARPQFWEGMAAYHAGRREYDQAIASLERSLTIEPKREQTWCELARVAIAKGDTSRARSSVQEALDLKPDYVPALELREQMARSNEAR